VERGIEAVHAFDHRSSLTAFWLSLITGVAATHTICGGTQRFSARYLPEIAVFSNELRGGYSRRDRQHVHVIPNRISFRNMCGRLSREPALTSVGLDPLRPTILVVCRLGVHKLKQVERALDLFEVLHVSRPELQLLVVGANQVGDISALRERVFAMKGVALDTEIYVDRAWQLNPCVDIVWGVGRSLYEGMYFGKAVFLMSSYCMAGLVTPDRRPAFFRTNFSGRDQLELSREEHLCQMARVLDDPAYVEALQLDGRIWLQENLDSAVTPRLYEALYHSVPRAWACRIPIVLWMYGYLQAGYWKGQMTLGLRR
jgi:hypothetical protein